MSEEELPDPEPVEEPPEDEQTHGPDGDGDEDDEE